LEIAEHEDNRSVTEVIRGAINHSRDKQDWKAQKEHGPGASLHRHWDRLPRGVRADVRKGIDPGIMARAFWQRVYDPHAWAAQKVNDASYLTGASHMADTARGTDIDAFMKATPGAEHFREEMANLLSRVNFQAGTSNWQMLGWAYGEAVKNARAKAATVKKAGKHVGGAPSAGRTRSNGSGNSSTTNAIVEAINAQRGTV
jgi:hypothetical protein